MITIEKIDENNVWEAIDLKVSKEQENYVATNNQSIIEAYLCLSKNAIALPFAIKKEGTVIGFAMIGYGKTEEDDPLIAENNYVLWRFMIDSKYQSLGYGREAMKVIIEYIKSSPVGKALHCWLSYDEDNVIAKKLYNSIGFVENQEFCDGEIVAVLKL